MPFSSITPRRYIYTAVAIVVSLHFILSISHEGYGHMSSLSSLKGHIQLVQNTTVLHGQNSTLVAAVSAETPDVTVHEPLERRANATFVLLARNSDLEGVVDSIRQMEDRFNHKYKYPWVLLNEEPFTDTFKSRVRVLTDAPISFGVIPKEHWYQPDWIDENVAKAARRKMELQRIIYAGSVPYRNMCRFNSGFFYQHELLKNYKYYWRVEPEVKFFCNLDYDPFLFMQDNNKVYSFTISLYEWEPTVATLWKTVKEFMAENPQYVSPNNSMDFLSDNGGETYNLCHYWSNFEIADMDFWRSEAYSKFFDFLESKGGFYYERWGDAPVHSIAASLFARKDQVHFFKDIGYRHPPFQHCPQGDDWSNGRCGCNPSDSFDYQDNSCLRRYESLFL